MSPVERLREAGQLRAPRVSGDEPVTKDLRSECGVCSPRERG